MSPVSAPITTDPAADADPFPSYKFWVEIESIIEAQFQECSGLKLERTVETVEEGGVNDHLQILPGRNKYSNITLKNGLMKSDALWKWYQEGLYDAKVKKINFSILLRNVKGEIVKRWNVIDGFPVRWEGPQFNSDSRDVAIETLEIAHHGLLMG